MPRPVSEPSDDVTVYLVLNDHGQFGIAYDETDPANADRETIIRKFLTGQYDNALRVVAFNAAEGWSWDVSEDIALEILQRAFDADDPLGDDTKRFIDRHVADPANPAPAADQSRRPDGQPQARFREAAGGAICAARFGGLRKISGEEHPEGLRPQPPG
jgi:hypothetical protein